MGRPSESWHPGCCPDKILRGLSVAHCAGCHETFSGPHAFDTHKRLKSCRKPRDCGMVLRDDGIWQWPPKAAMIKWLAKV